jgi:hypothetical protein
VPYVARAYAQVSGAEAIQHTAGPQQLQQLCVDIVGEAESMGAGSGGPGTDKTLAVSVEAEASDWPGLERQIQTPSVRSRCGDQHDPHLAELFGLQHAG